MREAAQERQQTEAFNMVLEFVTKSQRANQRENVQSY
jgi:hypothetical protein